MLMLVYQSIFKESFEFFLHKPMPWPQYVPHSSCPSHYSDGTEWSYNLYQAHPTIDISMERTTKMWMD